MRPWMTNTVLEGGCPGPGQRSTETADKGYLLLKVLWGFWEGMKTKLFHVALHNVEPCLHLLQVHTSPTHSRPTPLQCCKVLCGVRTPLPLGKGELKPLLQEALSALPSSVKLVPCLTFSPQALVLITGAYLACLVFHFLHKPWVWGLYFFKEHKCLAKRDFTDIFIMDEGFQLSEGRVVFCIQSLMKHKYVFLYILWLCDMEAILAI